MQVRTRTAPRKETGRRKAPHRTRTRRSVRYRSKEPGSIRHTESVIEITVPKKLKSGNKLKSGIARHGDTQSWEKHFLKAQANCVTEGTRQLEPMSTPVRMRLEVIRFAPRRDFFLDPTNLAIGVKGLEDALVRLGYLFDDAEEWIDGPHCANAVSEDKKYRTLVRLSVAAEK